METLFLEKIFVIFDKTPDLSATSNLKQAEKILLSIFLNLSLFLCLIDKEKGNFILPLEIDEISEINAEVVASGPAPSP